MKNKIEHVFVVMLENRSFDHMLGFSKITGTDSKTKSSTQIEGINDPHLYPQVVNSPNGPTTFYPTPDAPYSMKLDPPHEFKDTLEQLTGTTTYSPHNYGPIKNNGFAQSYSHLSADHSEDNLRCFTPDKLPVLTALAKEFAVCDHWFSSVPGPTWPNRFFVHAATSGGLDDSPQKKVVSEADFEDEFNFPNGTIFDQLSKKGIPWMIYEGDELSQSFALHGMHEYSDSHLRPFSHFKNDLSDPAYAPKYIFIEPSYGFVLTDKGSFKCGNSQHPLDDVRRGELLLKSIYDTIRSSPHWEKSCLLITYDEHGGFFDHVPPPSAPPPGDGILNPQYNQNGFSFDQLGVRVPSVIISPWIPKNTIDHTVYDHSSLLRTLENWLDLKPMTKRDEAANSFESLFTLESPRQDAPIAVTGPKYSGAVECNQCLNKIENLLISLGIRALKEIPLSPTTNGFLHLAFLKKIHANPNVDIAQETEKYNKITNKRDALLYIEQAKSDVKIHNKKVQRHLAI